MQRTLLPILIAMGVAGCANLPPYRGLTLPERSAAAFALEAWLAAGRPAGDYGVIAPDRVIVSEMSADEVNQRCGGCYPGPECRDVLACMWTPNVHAFDSPRLHIVVRDDVDGETHIALVVHEYLHALRGSVVLDLLERGAELPPWAVQGVGGAAGDIPDRPHRDGDLWGAIEADALQRWRSSL